MKSTHLTFIILITTAVMLMAFVSCDSDGFAGNGFQSFAWKPDGSGLIAIKQNYRIHSYTEGIQVETFDLLGNSIKVVTLEVGIPSVTRDDNIFFGPDGNSFFAQIGDDIYIVNPNDGSEFRLLVKHDFISASPSGKVFLAYSSNSDSTVYTTFSTDGSAITQIAAWNLTKSSIYPYFFGSRSRFVNDSIFFACYDSTNSRCSLSLFDTKFNLIYSAQDSLGADLISPSRTGSIAAYRSDSGFSIFNLSNHSVKHVKRDPGYVSELDLAWHGLVLAYTQILEEHRYAVDPRAITLFYTLTNEEHIITTDAVSSGRISPNGQFIAYFTEEEKDIRAHVVPIP